MIGLEAVYVLMGLMTAGIAWENLRDRATPRHLSNAAFWGLYALSFLAGTHMSDLSNGLLVIAMVLVMSIGKLGQQQGELTTAAARAESARRLGNRLFIPALAIPLLTVLGTLTLKSASIGGRSLIDPKQVTVISLALATVVALVLGLWILRPPASAPMREARRLMDSVGWAAVLPQMLAALGAVFALSGVGQIVASLAERWLPLGTPFAAVAAYTIGMAVFTIIMGNAFAAFPVMTAGIGLPLVVHQFGGNVIAVSAIGMLSGYCGTLMTPMAANFNIVPAALLELPSENAVIRVQVPTGLVLLAANTILMYLVAFR
jgi:uncharacterized membrane protein